VCGAQIGDVAERRKASGLRCLSGDELEIGNVLFRSILTGRSIPPRMAESTGLRNRQHDLHRIWHRTITGLEHSRLGFAKD
jgi:hypothetical protein